MTAAPARALVVDDERMNREVIVANLRVAGYETVTAQDGVEAWAILDSRPYAFDVILLDRRMPRMNGMELLARLKTDERLSQIPVIMQTAAAATEDVTEGIRAGVYYYLAKPLDRRLLLSVTEAAIADHRRRRRLQDDLARRTTAMTLLHRGIFRFRTLEEGHTLAVSLARVCPRARHLVAGLSELFTNAIEHGNLGIDFEEKARLVAERRWRQEVEARLDTPQGQSRLVEVTVERVEDALRFVIRDQGEGFDWRTFLQISPERAFGTHGRGIALARQLAFSRLDYNEAGNEVACLAPMDGTMPTAGLTDSLVSAGPIPTAVADPTHEAEIRLAQSMQRELMPSPIALAEAERRLGVTLSTHCETSSDLGGDLWGLQVVDDHHLGLWLADFTGHGLGAALNTFRLHTLVAQCTPLADMPAAFIGEINRRLVGLLPVGHYATMLYGVVDTRRHRFRYAAAGAPAPLVRWGNGAVERGDGAGLPLGLSVAAEYDERVIPLPAGTLLFLASDGLSGTPMDDGRRLDNDAIAALLAAAPPSRDSQAEMVLAPFLARVLRPLRDDLTVVCCNFP